MEKFFTTEGAVQPEIHYCLDPLRRINIGEMETLIDARKYFVLHAPRQTGKTTSLLALRDYLNQQGRYVAVYANVEAGQAYRNDVVMVQRGVIKEIGGRLSSVLKDDWPYNLATEINSKPDVSVADFLKTVCLRLTKPLVLFLDEIDALVGDSLVSVLRGLRSGYDQRPEAFPQSVVLCGVRDVSKCRIELSDQSVIVGGSAFNVCAKALRLADFSKEDIYKLYSQHTATTGQIFEDACFPVIWEATEGQPGLVNALANELTSMMYESQDRNVCITPEMVSRAKENIIHGFVAHKGDFIAKLHDNRIKPFMKLYVTQTVSGDDYLEITDEDIRYAEDIGLVKLDKPLRISNSIYKEVFNQL